MAMVLLHLVSFDPEAKSIAYIAEIETEVAVDIVCVKGNIFPARRHGRRNHDSAIRSAGSR